MKSIPPLVLKTCFQSLVGWGFLLLIIFSSGGMAQAGEEEQKIRWLKPDYAPSFLVDGPVQGLGMLDSMERYLQYRLPGKGHYSRQGNMKRIIATLAAGKQSCAFSLFKNPERAKVVEFSVPYLVVLPARIVIRKKDLPEFQPYLNAKGEISLQQLLRESPFTFGYASGRAYGAGLDLVIKAEAQESNSIASYSLTLSHDVLRMVQARRVDYTLAFSYEITYFSRSSSLQGEFVTLPAVEALVAVHNHVGCDKTPWGRGLIGQINKILKDSRSEPGFYGAYYAWLSLEDQRLYKQQVLHHYGRPLALK